PAAQIRPQQYHLGQALGDAPWCPFQADHVLPYLPPSTNRSKWMPPLGYISPVHRQPRMPPPAGTTNGSGRGSIHGLYTSGKSAAIPQRSSRGTPLVENARKPDTPAKKRADH